MATITDYTAKILAALLVVAFVTASTAVIPPVRAQDAAQRGAQTITLYAVTVYSEPDRDSAIVGVLVPQAKVLLEARSPDIAWVLGHNSDGSIRGWMQSRHLALNSSDEIAGLLVSNEQAFIPPESPTDLDRIYATINLGDYPIIPSDMGRARAIFERSQQQSKDPHSVSKIGDCISDNQHFLSPFGLGRYALGTYTYLQPMIDHFESSLAVDSLAAYDGLVTSAVLDPVFANPGACLPGETPLRCEYRVHNPGVAIIMFGAQDLLFTSPEDFDRNLRRIVHETIQAGVVPVVSTFPGNLERWDQSIRYNQILVAVALDYDVPLMNLWRALDGLPNHGLNADGRHLSLPVTHSGDLTPENLQRGYPMRNLVTLQALDRVWREVMR